MDGGAGVPYAEAGRAGLPRASPSPSMRVWRIVKDFMIEKSPAAPTWRQAGINDSSAARDRLQGRPGLLQRAGGVDAELPRLDGERLLRLGQALLGVHGRGGPGSLADVDAMLPAGLDDAVSRSSSRKARATVAVARPRCRASCRVLGRRVSGVSTPVAAMVAICARNCSYGGRGEAGSRWRIMSPSGRLCPPAGPPPLGLTLDAASNGEELGELSTSERWLAATPTDPAR